MGPVYTQEMPAVDSSDGSFNANTSDAQAAFNRDPRRKELTIWCENFGIWFGVRKDMVLGSTSAHLPAGGSATIRHQDAVFVRGDTGTALVSYISEQWAD